MGVLLQLQACRRQLGRQTFGPFDLAMGQGEQVAILGPSGAGKSTLLKLMAGEHRPDSGTVQLAGRSLTHWSAAALSQQRAVLAQHASVAFALPCELVIGLGRIGCPAGNERQVVQAAAALAGCAPLLARPIDTLSGGEAARVHLARLFAQLWDTRDGLILVDEPLSALDPALQQQLAHRLAQFARARGHALVAVLHDINHAVRHFDRLLLVRAGQLVDDLPTRALDAARLRALYGIRFSQARSDCGQALWLPAA